MAAVYTYRESSEKEVASFNIQKVFEEFDMSKELKAGHDKEVNFRVKEIDSLEAYINVSMNSADGMTDDDYRASAQRIMVLRKELEELEGNHLAETDQKIQAQLVQYIKDFGKKGEYASLIGYNSDYPVVYSDSTMNVTDELIVFINTKYSGK
jgi:outer membrane protein